MGKRSRMSGKSITVKNVRKINNGQERQRRAGEGTQRRAGEGTQRRAEVTRHQRPAEVTRHQRPAGGPREAGKRTQGGGKRTQGAVLYPPVYPGCCTASLYTPPCPCSRCTLLPVPVYTADVTLSVHGARANMTLLTGLWTGRACLFEEKTVLRLMTF